MAGTTDSADGTTAELDPRVRALATGRNFGVLSTIAPDGRPRTHVMWVDADDHHLIINTEVHRAKHRDVLRDPRVTVTVWDAEDPYRFAEVRGRVVARITGPEARAHIDACAQRYLGRDYPGTITSERVVLRIAPEHVHLNGIR